MTLDRHKTVREAIAYVSGKPEWPTDVAPLDMPIWEIVTRNLFEHANNPDARVYGSMGRAVRAQRIILNRSAGVRTRGTAPAQAADSKIKFEDLTNGELSV